ncbi:MAG: class I SAM-dependent methyltransferase [Gemmataceae bacterium]
MMGLFWDAITEPALAAIEPKCIVEIGSHEGISTRSLMNFCAKHNAVLNVIDPAPDYDVSTWEREYGNRLVFHRGLSLEVLPKLDKFEAIFIDGDHNWYTVIHELKAIESRSRELAQSFPLTFLHDIGWPYGRRDLYYNPATIPPECRHPFANRGLRPGVAGVVERGFNDHQNNAVTENTPRNGVLTAVEDYLKETSEKLRFIQIPGFYGLGILFPESLPLQNQAFADFLDTWDLPEPVLQFLQMVETGRVEYQANANELWMALQQVMAQRQSSMVNPATGR